MSGLRSSAEQRALRVQNCPDPDNSDSMDCSPPTAKVGTSRHEQGLAVDIGPSSAYAAAGAAAGQFGLRATVPGEPWHFELSGGGSPVQGVTAGLGGLGDLSGAVSAGLGATSAAVGAIGNVFRPAWWLRVGVGTAGVGLALAGLVALTGAQLSGLVA